MQELEAIKARVREMEEEAEKLKEMQNEVEKQMNMSPPPGNGKNLNCTFKKAFCWSIECYLLATKLQLLPISIMNVFLKRCMLHSALQLIWIF